MPSSLKRQVNNENWCYKNLKDTDQKLINDEI